MDRMSALIVGGMGHLVRRSYGDFLDSELDRRHIKRTRVNN